MNLRPDINLAIDVIRQHLTIFDVMQTLRLEDSRMKLTIEGDTKRIYEKKLGGKVDKFIVILSNEEIKAWLDAPLGIYISMSTVDLPGALTLINLDHCKLYIKNRVLADYGQHVNLWNIHISEVNKRATVFLSSHVTGAKGNLDSKLTHGFRNELDRIQRYMQLAIVCDRQTMLGDFKNVWTEKELAVFYK